MKKFWAQLKPQERRWVAAVGIGLFLILNYFMVWPRFADWKKNTKRMQTAQENARKYRAEISHMEEYRRKINGLLAEGQNVELEDQVINFERFCRDRASENGVPISYYGRPTIRTNDEFFFEQEVGIQVASNETNLVDFLYSLGSSNSSMRVRAMSLQPLDQNRYQLSARLTLVASYQKKNPTPVAKPAATPAKPAPTPQPKTPAVTQPPRAGQPASTSTGTSTKSPAISTNKPGPLNPKNK